MQLLETLTDDQVALLGCFLAFVASGVLLSITHYLGPNPRRSPSAAALPPHAHPVMAKVPLAPHTDADLPARKAA